MSEGAVRALKAAIVVMGVLIVLGIIGLIAAVAYRGANRNPTIPLPPTTVPIPGAALPDLILDEPPGTRIATISQTPDRTTILLQGPSQTPDRIIVVDTRTGQIIHRIRLAR